MLTRDKSLPGLLLLIMLVTSLSCSVGRLLVKAPTPTLAPTKTPRPTFTFTPYYTPTPLPTPTVTNTPLPPTVTPTSEPTATPQVVAVQPTSTPVPPPPTNTPVPPPPTNTPPPTATPAPQYPFTITPYIHDTGSALETRVTAHVVKEIDFSIGSFESLVGYQFVLVDPLGREQLSNMSGGRNHSTGEGLGDDHWFNVEAKISPYTPGTYRAWLIKDGVQQSPEVEFTLASTPFQYVHLDIFQYR